MRSFHTDVLETARHRFFQFFQGIVGEQPLRFDHHRACRAKVQWLTEQHCDPAVRRRADGARGSPSDGARYTRRHPVDLSRWDAHWPALFRGVDAVVHLAGNPVAYHDCPELIGPNIDAMLNMFEAAARERVKRVVFASSNHVMGGYQEIPGISITESLPPKPGLRYFADGAERFSGAYVASKLIGERTCSHFAEARGLEVIAVRIGWVWRGQNEPSQLPAERGDWFRNMWLSDRDYVHLMERCLSAALPNPFVIINGMSTNTGMRWDLTMARTLLEYQPQDDVFSDSR